MKSLKLFFYATIALFMLSSCDLSQINVDKLDQLIGTWELTNRKTHLGTEDPTPEIIITFYESGKYVKEYVLSQTYEEGSWKYDGNKTLHFSVGEIGNNYFIEALNSSTLTLYIGNPFDGSWTEESYIKVLYENTTPQGGIAGAPARIE